MRQRHQAACQISGYVLTLESIGEHVHCKNQQNRHPAELHELGNTLEWQQQGLFDDRKDGQLDHRESALIVFLLGRHFETNRFHRFESGNGIVSWQPRVQQPDEQLASLRGK